MKIELLLNLVVLSFTLLSLSFSVTGEKSNFATFVQNRIFFLKNLDLLIYVFTYD